MTIPGRVDAARLLLALDPPAWFLRHACAVADVAAWLAARAAANGQALDRGAVEAAALLHDVDKLPAAGRPSHTRHGDGSAAWLEAHGLASLAPLVLDHPVTRLAEVGPATRLANAPLEARIVAYADKRAGQRLEPMAARFASWAHRYPSGPADRPGAPRMGDTAPGAGDTATRAGDPSAPSTRSGWGDDIVAVVLARSLALEAGVCAAAGVAPADVRRLRWSRRALRVAAA
jgi:hypothetical protein